MTVLLQSMLPRVEDLSYHPSKPWLAVCGEGQVCLWSDDGTLLVQHNRPGVSAVAFGPQATLAWAVEESIEGAPPFQSTADWRLDLRASVTDFAWVDAEHVAVLLKRTEVVLCNVKTKDTRALASNSGGGTTHAVQLVGVFDISKNR